MMRIQRRSARSAAILSLSLLAMTATACDDDDPVGPGDLVAWSATLAGETIDGVAAVVSTNNAFEAAIEIEGADEGDVFLWEVAQGTCAAPGARVGAANRYPELEADAEGAAAAEAEVTAQLDEEGDYIVRVIDDSGENPVTVSCGALEVDEE